MTTTRKNISVIQTTKFKEVVIEARFLSELKRPRATVRALLVLMLQDRLMQYPTKKAMSGALDNLYGASLSARSMGYGKAETLTVRLRAISEKYARPGQLLKQIRFFHEVLFAPLLSDEVFDEAKKVLRDDLMRTQENPREYAVKEALKLAGENHALSISCNGDLRDLTDITLEDVKAEYERMMLEDDVMVSLIGDVKEKEAERFITEYLPFQNRSCLKNPAYLVENTPLRKKEELRNVEQSNVILVYNTNIMVNAADYWALRLGCTILGQLPVSLLFTEVREAKGLCYAISSSVVAFDGVMLISTGIDYRNYQQVNELIEQQIKRVVEKDYDVQLLEMAKKLLISQLRTSEDDAGVLLNLAYQNYLLDRTETSADIMERLSTFTMDDVCHAFMKLQPNCIYVSFKEETHEEN